MAPVIYIFPLTKKAKINFFFAFAARPRGRRKLARGGRAAHHKGEQRGHSDRARALQEARREADGVGCRARRVIFDRPDKNIR